MGCLQMAKLVELFKEYGGVIDTAAKNKLNRT